MKIFKILFFVIVIILAVCATVFFLTRVGYNTAKYGKTAPLTWQPDQKIELCWDANANVKRPRGILMGSPICSVGDGFIRAPNFKILGAVEYCKYLKSDGVTIFYREINYWRLPTEAELKKELLAIPYLADGSIPSGSFEASIAKISAPKDTTLSYWTSSDYKNGPDKSCDYGYSHPEVGVFNQNCSKNDTVSVRCVH